MLWHTFILYDLRSLRRTSARCGDIGCLINDLARLGCGFSGSTYGVLTGRVPVPQCLGQVQGANVSTVDCKVFIASCSSLR